MISHYFLKQLSAERFSVIEYYCLITQYDINHVLLQGELGLPGRAGRDGPPVSGCIRN